MRPAKFAIFQENRILPVRQLFVIDALAGLTFANKPDILHFLEVVDGLEELVAHRADIDHLAGASVFSSAFASGAGSSAAAAVSAGSASTFFSSTGASSAAGKSS